MRLRLRFSPRSKHTLAACSLVVPLWAGAQPVAEYDLKAAFVYNFALFTEWPAGTSFEGGSLNICIDPSSPMRAALQALTGKTIKGRPVALRALASADAVQACHVLVVDGGARSQGSALIAAAGGRPILTVADEDRADFGVGIEREHGGSMISLGMADGRITFNIDNAAANRAGLVLSSKLLRLARGVR